MEYVLTILTIIGIWGWKLLNTKWKRMLLNSNNYNFERDFSMDYFEFIQSYRRRTKVMTECRTPKFCERYKVDIGIYDLKSRRTILKNVKRKDICVYIHKNHYCVIWKKIRKDSLLNGAEEIERNFKHIENMWRKKFWVKGFDVDFQNMKQMISSRMCLDLI